MNKKGGNKKLNKNNLKICISSTGKDLDAEVNPRFGRCSYFLVIDTETLSFNYISNESAMASGGAGIQAAQTVAKTGAKVLITGNVGPNAFQTLKAAGIKIITGVSGNIKDVLDKFNQGELKEIEGPTVESHFGMNNKGGEKR